MIKLVDVLVKPEKLLEVPPSALSDIVSEARYFNMLAQLKYLCESKGYWSSLPKKFTSHLSSASLFYENQRRKLEIEAEEITKVLTPLNVQWMYLKGGAYHLNGMTGFSGRMMSDIDILVEESAISRVEAAFKDNSWVSAKISNYDEKFYRSWSQEIPPLRHLYRQVELDVHFNILPKTLKETVDGKYLFEQAIPMDSRPYQKVLKPHAMLIHSAIHLFYESEYHKGLRDLYDIWILIENYSAQENFWDDLIDLQSKIGNEESIYLALRYSKMVYNASIPSTVLEHYDRYKPNKFYLSILDFCFLNVFTSMYPPHKKLGHSFSEGVLYLRGHLKRMPLRLLIPHLTKKSIDKLKIQEEEVRDII
ncbi:nucleotidyltransferase family protein [Vibrio alginolyticus]